MSQLLLYVVEHPEIDLAVWTSSVFSCLRVYLDPRGVIVDVLVFLGAKQYDIMEPLDAWHC